MVHAWEDGGLLSWGEVARVLKWMCRESLPDKVVLGQRPERLKVPDQELLG